MIPLAKAGSLHVILTAVALTDITVTLRALLGAERYNTIALKGMLVLFF